jgi:hypothetical protein
MRRTVPRQREPGVLLPTQSPPAESQWWSRLLDGAHHWGSFDATVGRYGVRRYRLIVYPPGISTTDRRLARLWRGWPITGAVLGLIAIMLFGNEVASPNAVLAWAVAVYVGFGALLFLRAGPARVEVRSRSIILMPKVADARERRKYIEWQTVVWRLTRADQLLRTGAISLVEHEASWWEAYDRLEEITHV